jgi:hypothetical protein
MHDNRPHPHLRKRVLDQRASLIRWSDMDYPDFAETARAVLSEHVTDDRFDFVIYRLWREDCGEPPLDYEAELPGRYERFVANFPWQVNGAPEWATESRILSTLRFWQPLYPARLSASHAVSMMAGLRNAFGLSHA